MARSPLDRRAAAVEIECGNAKRAVVDDFNAALDIAAARGESATASASAHTNIRLRSRLVPSSAGPTAPLQRYIGAQFCAVCTANAFSGAPNSQASKSNTRLLFDSLMQFREVAFGANKL